MLFEAELPEKHLKNNTKKNAFLLAFSKIINEKSYRKYKTNKSKQES